MLYLFTSGDFFLFFISLFFVYWIFPQNLKNIILLSASYVFYASWNWKLLGLLVVSTIVDYFLGLKISQSSSNKIKKIYLISSVVFNLSLLGFFKYFNFFIENIITLLNALGFDFAFASLNIILPLGISFYTFQKLSYIIDVYNNKIAPTKNIIDFSLYIAYFPHLIAGPIERAKDLISRIQAEKFFKQIDFKVGGYLFVYGLFQKIVLADSVAMIVKEIDSATNPSGAQVLIATYAFAIQIYCDFCGYSNMARGISNFLGIKLSTNFNLPYFSKNPSEFWKRWHITLSKWIMDYLYLPLGGSKTFFFGYMPLLATFLLIGLWHGAAWNFIFWGLYWFVIIMSYRILKGYKINSSRFLAISNNKFINFVKKLIITLLFFQIICFSWIIFKAQSLEQIIIIFESLFKGINLFGLFNVNYLYFYIIIIFLILYEGLQYYKRDQLFLPKCGFYYQMIFYLVLFFMYLEIGAIFDVRFLYFQF